MLIAHAPAGYLLTRALARTVFKRVVDPVRSNHGYQAMMAAGILGGIFPDFDFIYHIFIDSDRTPHHSYLTHFPLFWIALLGIALLAGRAGRFRKWLPVTVTFCSSAILHLVFDTLTGVVYWLAPFSHTGLNIYDVSDIHVWWVENYLYHWTFLVEIGIVVAAGVIFLRIRETTACLYLYPRSADYRAGRFNAVRRR